MYKIQFTTSTQLKGWYRVRDIFGILRPVSISIIEQQMAVIKVSQTFKVIFLPGRLQSSKISVSIRKFKIFARHIYIFKFT